ncbi:AzlC family ABC transporter permease [Aliiroseovarius subalbicans]|uniref:AzlC family ABC transporter permease n=1 Tax=Aliiroseovarius subalbicans TaxID=2925840 RepID=UPI001F5AF4BE|nr:AzlC family ABC transporter permease [Aliiroseovarius subalbicans]MCI2399575.1 AzlC family ABC transporter permease [Aliiroseovarius subalbicans]
MTTSNLKSVYWKGVRDGAPFILVVIPFALLFGVVATEAGLNVAEVMGFSVLVIAGAAQFTALQLMVDEAPTVIILATALAVNLRMAMYSASLTPYLGQATPWQRVLIAYFLVDQSYALGHAKYESSPQMTLSERLAYYAGVLSPVAPGWYGASLAGALVGTAIPPVFALDFAVPITFLAMIAPALRSLAHIAAAATSVVLTLAFFWMPYGTGLLAAALVAMIVGAQVEQVMARRRPA